MGLAAIPVIFSHLGMDEQDLTCTLLRPESEALVRIWGPPASRRGNAVHARPPGNLMQGATKSINPNVLGSSTPRMQNSKLAFDRRCCWPQGHHTAR